MALFLVCLLSGYNNYCKCTNLVVMTSQEKEKEFYDGVVQIGLKNRDYFDVSAAPVLDPKDIRAYFIFIQSNGKVMLEFSRLHELPTYIKDELISLFNRVYER